MFGAAMGPALEPWQSFAVMIGWIVVALAAAAVLLKRRDA
jgi:ABC-type transport system involved in multi-copper enzyme maturation permease subunit